MRNWFDYDKYSSEVKQIGVAVKGLHDVFTDLVQNALEPQIIAKTHKSSSGNSLEEERFIFYAGFGLDVFVQGQTHGLGKERVSPPFHNARVMDITWYLLSRALFDQGVKLKEFENFPMKTRGKSCLLYTSPSPRD